MAKRPAKGSRSEAPPQGSLYPAQPVIGALRPVLVAQEGVYEVWTDGSCRAPGREGAWGARIIRPDGWYADIYGFDAFTTNNRMEMTPILRALELFHDGARVRVTSDSGIAVFPFMQDWITDWRLKGWRGSNGKPVKNQDLWELILQHAERLQVEWCHVRGHGRDGKHWPHNVAMDELAGRVMRFGLSGEALAV